MASGQHAGPHWMATLAGLLARLDVWGVFAIGLPPLGGSPPGLACAVGSYALWTTCLPPLEKRKLAKNMLISALFLQRWIITYILKEGASVCMPLHAT